MSTARPIIETAITPAPLTAASAGGIVAGGGARCDFTGSTRPERHPELGDLEALEYESAGVLAEASLRDLARAIAARHGLLGLRVEHALGRVPVGEASVRIEAVAAHRDAAFDGCRAMIDRLKREVPIWKRECWQRGSTWSSRSTPLVAPIPTIAESAS